MIIRLHRMLLAVVVVCLSFLQYMPMHCFLVPQLTAKLEDPVSKGANRVQKARVCESKPHVTRRLPNIMRGCRVLDGVSAEFKCCGNSFPQRPSNSYETPQDRKRRNSIRNSIRKTDVHASSVFGLGSRRIQPDSDNISLRKVSTVLACTRHITYGMGYV